MSGLQLFVIFGLIFSFSASPTPQPAPSDNDVNRVAAGLYCPVCNGITLDICTEQVCSDMRELIRRLLEQGYTDADVRDYFSEQYGPSVLVDPSSTNWGWVLYSVPLLGLTIGVIVWYTSLQSRRKSGLSEISYVDHDEERKSHLGNDGER